MEWEEGSKKLEARSQKARGTEQGRFHVIAQNENIKTF